MSVEMPGCGKCPIKVGDRLCQTEDGKSPAFCPTENHPEVLQKVLEEYKKPEIREFARQASIQEGQGYKDKELGNHRVCQKDEIQKTGAGILHGASK